MYSISVMGGLAGSASGTPGGNLSPLPTTKDESFNLVSLFTRLQQANLEDDSYNDHTLTDGGAGAVFDNVDFRFFDGSWSLDNSSTGYISAADHASFNLGAEDFTVECWVYFDSDPGSTDDSYFISQWDESGDQRGWALLLTNDTIVWKYSTAGTSGTVTSLSATWTPTNGQWYWVAACRSNGITRIFVDGVLLAVGADAATYHNSTAQLRLGTPVNTGDGNFQRNLHEARITKGLDRYG